MNEPSSIDERAARRTAELQRANERLEREIAERQRLERENLEISTHERQWFAQELHDGLCQQLSTLSFMTASLKMRLDGCRETAPEVVEQVRRIAELAERSVREGRALARGLFPVELEHGGLLRALRHLAADTAAAYGVDCRVLSEEEAPPVDHLAATNLYRIAQEALSNAVRHGRADCIALTLATVGGTLRLRIADDGVGIAEQPVGPEHGGIGLRTMRRRARTIGAALEIGPGEESGTVVECRLPL